MTDRKTFQAPRELIKWVEKLNLSYKITNFRRDLSNGYIISEILFRYDEKINKNYFRNKFSLKSKFKNFVRIQKILKEKNFEISDEFIRKIIFMEKDASLDFLILLYKFFTKKKFFWKKPIFKENPYYQNKTVNFLMKNRELNSKVDFVKKQKSKLKIISNYFENQKVQKKKLGIKKFIIRKKKEIIKNYLKKIKSPKKKNSSQINSILNEKEFSTKMIKLKNYELTKNSNIKNMGFSQKRENFLISIGEIIEKHFKHVEKCFIFKKNNFPEILFDPITFETELIDLVFKILIENIEEIHEKISNNIINFYFLFLSLIEFINKIKNTKNNFFNIKKFFFSLGKILLEEEKEFITVFMENTGFVIIKNLCCLKFNKICYASVIIDSLISKNAVNRVRAICKLKDIFGNNLKVFYNLLANFAEFDIFKDEEKIYFNILLYYGLICYKSPSVSNIVVSLKILYEICYIDVRTIAYELMDLNLKRVFKLNYWEIEVLLLILSCKIINSYSEDKKRFNNKIDSGFEDNRTNSRIKSCFVIDSNENIDVISETNSKKSDIKSINDSNLIKSTPQKQNKKEEDNLEYKNDTENFFLNLIKKIFKKGANTNVIKIGLVYLSPLLNNYKTLIPLYLEILLNLEEKTLYKILSEKNIDKKKKIVKGCKSFAYCQTGAHIKWDSLGIASALQNFFFENELKFLNKKYCFIIINNLKQKINCCDFEKWLEIFKNLEFLIINSFRKFEISEDILLILKKFMEYDFIKEYFICNSFDKVFECLLNIYDNGNNYCVENHKKIKNVFYEFMNFLSLKEEFFEFVYNLLKKYSEVNFCNFRKSNLSLLLNTIACKRRNEIFGDKILNSILNNI